MIVEVLIKSLFILLVVVAAIAPVITWIERKQSAVMQDRIGANRADINGITVLGLLHPLADVIKLLSKEDVVPLGANRVMHLLAPLVAAAPAVVAFAVIPFGGVYTFGELHALARRRQSRLGPALHLRDRLDRHLRHRDGGLVEQQQLVAARRPARVGPDDLVRGHDGALRRRRLHGVPDAEAAGHVRSRRTPRFRVLGFLQHLFGDAACRRGSTGCGCRRGASSTSRSAS